MYISEALLMYIDPHVCPKTTVVFSTCMYLQCEGNNPNAPK